MADIVAKVFLWWRTKILKTADALRARRLEGPHSFLPKRPPTFVMAPESLAAAGASKNRPSRDFRRRSIFDFCNSRHQTDMPRCPLFGRYQRESGHNSDIVKPTRLTQLRHEPSVRLHNSISSADQSTTARHAMLATFCLSSIRTVFQSSRISRHQ